MAIDDLELVVSPRRDLLEAELLEYWTPEAMESAQTLLPELDRGSVTEALLENESQLPEASEDTVGPPGAQALSIEPQPPIPATGSRTEQVPNRAALPYCPVGKIFMTFNGSNYVGSAWVVAGAGVFTAGHCVWDASMGGWADKILFVPQHHDGTSPVGQWTAIQIASLKGWTANRDFKFDLAAFKTDRPVQPTTGSVGWKANSPANQGPYTGAGYPAGAHPTHGFDGRRMWRSTGNYKGGSNPIQAWNDMTGGCSGGPWLVWKDGKVHANGLNSFRYNDDPSSMYSPYFGQGVIDLYNWVK